MKGRSLVIRAEAYADAEEAREHYRTINPSLGTQFLSRLNDAVTLVHEFPEHFGVAWRNVRAKRLKKFPYVVYYRIHASFVEIIATMHGSRDPSAWQSRV